MLPFSTLHARQIAPQPTASQTSRAAAFRAALAEGLGLSSPAATNAEIFAAIDANTTPPARARAPHSMRPVRAQQGDADETSYETLYPSSPLAKPSARAMSAEDAAYAAVFGTAGPEAGA